MQPVILNEAKRSEESFKNRDSSFRFTALRMACVFALLVVSNLFFSQKQFILIDSQTKKKFIKKDSLSAVKFLDSLAENNFYFTKILTVEKDNQITKISFDKGKNFNEAQVKLSSDIAENLKMKPDFYTKNLDSLKKSINQKYIDQGFAFSRVKTKYTGIINEIPQVEISINSNQQRKINGFVVRGYERVPKRFIKNLDKEFNGKIYDDRNLVKINNSMQNHPFVLLERTPQTLFTKDSTNIYLFLQKKKANYFDGILGFGNDKSQKFTFNGSLNLGFRNMFNGFESLNIFWQRNPDRGQTFDLKVDLPYFAGSNVGINVQANIYRQDTAYATVRLQPAVYLYIKNRQKLTLRGTFETSTVTDTLYTAARDYSKKGLSLWYDYIEPSEVPLFLYHTRITAEMGFLQAFYQKENQSIPQTNYHFLGERNFHITGNNYLNLKAESAMLNSKSELSANEMLRFGGWNSIRGFNENSLFANFYYYLNAEYRYTVGSTAFFDIFGQFGQLNNNNLQASPKLYSFGLGFNFLLPIGIMSLQIANGSDSNSAIRFLDTKIHWGILARF